MMKFRMCMLPLALVGLAALATAAPAFALRVAAPPPTTARAVQADVIVTGKVSSIEPMDIQLAPFPGSPNKANFKVAVITVDEVIKGVAGQKTVRVAFQGAVNPGNPGGGIRPLPGRGGMQVHLQNGTDGLFYLAKTDEAGVYQVRMYYDIVNRSAPTFAKDVAEAKEVGQILANPMAALKDTMREKRVNAAILLVTKYRSVNVPGATKQEPIDAEESKLILSALALADWNQPARFGTNHPMFAFNMLGVTEKDGWRQPQVVQNPQDLPNAMQAWLANNSGTYRIQRIVPANQASDR